MVLLSVYKNNLYHNFCKHNHILEAVRQESSIMRKISRYISEIKNIFFYVNLKQKRNFKCVF